MSNVIAIVGESGSGKSTSLRNLNPKETFIIQVVNKQLPWRAWKKNYTLWDKDKKTGNRIILDKSEHILLLIKMISEKKPEIKNIIIDDFQYILSNEFMRRINEKSYQKFNDIGFSGWDLIESSKQHRDDLNIIFTAHSEIDSNGKLTMKTIGNILKEKITIEGLFTIDTNT